MGTEMGTAMATEMEMGTETEMEMAMETVMVMVMVMETGMETETPVTGPRGLLKTRAETAVATARPVREESSLSPRSAWWGCSESVAAVAAKRTSHAGAPST